MGLARCGFEGDYAEIGGTEGLIGIDTTQLDFLPQAISKVCTDKRRA